MDAITDYLENYQELWYSIDDDKNMPRTWPMYDVIMEKCDEDDYYGCDFSGNQKVYQFTFTGQSNYFPGICNVDDVDEMDKYPVYVFDLASNNPCVYIGNFKQYMTLILENYINCNPSKKLMKTAQSALNDLSDFSDEVRSKKYKLKPAS